MALREVPEHPWVSQGRPGATKDLQKEVSEGQVGPHRGSGSDKMEPKAVAEAKRLNFHKSAPRPAPADAPGTSDLANQPKIDPESSQIGFSEPRKRSDAVLKCFQRVGSAPEEGQRAAWELPGSPQE